jgi:hypothetical protein
LFRRPYGRAVDFKRSRCSARSRHDWEHRRGQSSFHGSKQPSFRVTSLPQATSLGHNAAIALIAVGTALTGRPPHRSVREALPHTAPTLGQTSRQRLAHSSACAAAWWVRRCVRPCAHAASSPRSNPFPRQAPPAGVAPAFVRLRRQYYEFV